MQLILTVIINQLVTKEEMSEMFSVFQEINTGSTGVITESELSRVLGEAFPDMEEQEKRDIYKVNRGIYYVLYDILWTVYA